MKCFKMEEIWKKADGQFTYICSYFLDTFYIWLWEESGLPRFEICPFWGGDEARRSAFIFTWIEEPAEIYRCESARKELKEKIFKAGDDYFYDMGLNLKVGCNPKR